MRHLKGEPPGRHVRAFANSWRLVSEANLSHDDDGCLAQWDCEYDDGTQIRYLV